MVAQESLPTSDGVGGAEPCLRLIQLGQNDNRPNGWRWIGAEKYVKLITLS